MNIDLTLVGKKGLELMEGEISRLIDADPNFFTDRFPFDGDKRNYLRCLNSYEASGGEVSPDFQRAISQNQVFKNYCLLMAEGDYLYGFRKDRLSEDTRRILSA